MVVVVVVVVVVVGGGGVGYNSWGFTIQYGIVCSLSIRLKKKRNLT